MYVTPSSPIKRTYTSLEFVSPLKTPKEERVKKRPRLMQMLPRDLYSSNNDNIEAMLEKLRNILEIKKQDEPEEVAAILNYLDKLALKELSLGQRLAELGILYFYIAKCPSLAKLPKEESYIEARYQEIEQIACSYKTAHRHHCPAGLAKLHPSGRTAYLIRAFARMILPPDGTFNLGGCYAVKELLNSSLGSHLSEEMHLQILSTIDSLMTDPKLVQLLLEPCPVHQDMEEIIRIDLKLPVNVQIFPSHVRWHLLIALFSVVGQTDEDNCYSVAAIANLFRNHPAAMVAFSRELLTRAAFLFDGVEIPILTLLATKRKHEKDFFESVMAAGSKELLSLQVAHRVLGTENKELKPRVTLLHQVMKEQFGDQADQAKEITLSLKMNLQQHCIMAALEFVAHNSLDTTVSTSSREDLRRFITSHILKDFSVKGVDASEQTQVHEFISSLSARLIHNLLFVNYREWSFYIDEGRVCFPDHSQGIKSEKDPFNTWEPFHFIKRLCFLKEGMLTPVDTISGLGETLLEIVDLTFPNGTPFREKFKQYVAGERFKKYVSIFIEKQNKEDSPLKWERYYKSDSLFFLQDGGYTPIIMHWEKLNELFETTPIVIKDSESPLHFFLSLCDVYGKHPALLKRSNPLVLATKSDHAFNITPSSFSNYFVADTQEEIQDKITSRGEALMNKNVSWNRRCAIIRNALTNGEAKRILARITRRESDFNAFRSELSSLLSTEDLKKVDNEINNSITNIHLDEFLNQIPSLLCLIGLPNDEIMINKFREYITKYYQKRDYSSFELAQMTRQAFLLLHYPCLTLHQTECFIVDLFQLPRKIDLGNLNWVSAFSEILCHTHLILDYDIARRAFFFTSQKKDKEEPIEQDFSQDILKKIELFLPKF